MGKFEKGNKYSFANLTAEERHKMGKIGGDASGEARSFDALLRKIGREVQEGDDKPNKERVALKLYELAIKGNMKAIELLMRALHELDASVTLNIRQPRDLTPEEAAALQKYLEETN